MKKKILKTVALLLAAAMSLTLHAVNSITYTATYDLGNVNTGTDTLGGVTYTTVTYDGLFNGGNPGAPSLPIDYIRFSVPYNATNFSVNAVLRNSSVSYLPHLVYPCQTPRMMEDTLPSVITLPDSSIYYSGSFYPVNNAWVVDEGFLAGENHIVTVAVMPISFRRSGMGHLVNNLLRESGTVNLTLSYDLSDTLNMYPLVRRDSILKHEGRQLARRIVVNPDSVIAYSPMDTRIDSVIFMDIKPDGGITQRVLPNDSSGISHDDPYDPNPGVLYYEEYPYLIITTAEFEHSLRRLKALKEQLGYRVNIVTLDQIYNHRIASQGDIEYHQGNAIITDTTDAGKIRRYLKIAFATQNTKYVLLAGNNIPFKIVEVDDENVPTDWYYYDLNSNVSTEKIDMYPDLIVGRLLVKTPEQINNYTDKVLRYEINPGNGDYSYLKKAIVTEGNNLDKFNQFNSLVLNDLTNFFPIISYIKEQDNNCYPKGRDVIDSINTIHYAFMSSLNHGSKNAIRVYGPDLSNKNYFIWALENSKYNFDTEIGNGLDNLQNRDYPMIYYSLCCSTIPFGYSGISFAESFTTGKNYGGPVYIGNTTTVYGPPSVETFKLFLSQLPIANYKAGIAYAISKNGLNRDFLSRNKKNALAHNYIGDPSINIWTDEPQNYSNCIVTRADSTITITGIDVDSTIVSINNGGHSRKLMTGATRSLNVTFDKVSSNSTVMLYKHNYIPYIAPLLLQNASIMQSEYVIACDVNAGCSVDPYRSNGEVSIKQGVEYEIEASGVVRLEDGFRVEKGATFAVYPSSF